MSETTLKRRTKETTNHVDDSSADAMADDLDNLLDDKGGVAEAAAAPESRAVTKQELPGLPPPAKIESLDGAIMGAFDQKDIRTPLLKCVQGSTELKEHFAEGTVIFGMTSLLDPPPIKQEDLAKAGKVTIIPFRIIKQFRQNLTDEQAKSGMMPSIVDTLDEVLARGGTIEWQGRTRPSWSPYGTLHCLVRAPEGQEDNPSFSLSLDGDQYGAAEYRAGGGAFFSSVQQILNVAVQQCLEPKLDENGQPLKTESGVIRKVPVVHKYLWTFQVARKKAGEHLVFRPVLQVTNEAAGPQVRDYCAGVLQGF